jgi:WxL interacting protein linking bacterial and host surfaces
MTRALPSPRSAVAAALLALAALPAGAQARARFAVDPQGASSARGYYVFHASPDTVAHGRVRIANLGNHTGVVRLSAVDASTGATTGAVYGAGARGPLDVGAWTTLSRSSVRLAPRTSTIVHFTVRVPEETIEGDHLGGIVAEGARRPATGRSRQSGRFRIDVRSQTIVAIEMRVPGPRRPSLALTGLRAGGQDGRQALLLGVRNDGNVLVKGRGRLVVSDAKGRRLQNARFPIDTFVARTAIALPVAVTGRALPAGRYHAVAELRYDGRVTRRTFDFAISDHQVDQVFHSRPGLLAPHRSLITVLVGGAAFALAGFAIAAAIFRRPRRRQEAAAVEGRSGS